MYIGSKSDARPLEELIVVEGTEVGIMSIVQLRVNAFRCWGRPFTEHSNGAEGMAQEGMLFAHFHFHRRPVREFKDAAELEGGLDAENLLRSERHVEGGRRGRWRG